MYKIIIGAVLALSLVFSVIYFNYKVKTLEKENTLLVNNIRAYEKDLWDLQDSLNIIRGTYRVTIGDLEKSLDKVTKDLNSKRKELGIKDIELKELRYFKATFKKDTTINIIYNDSCEFKAKVIYNPQTIFEVESKKINGIDSLTHKADISASFKSFNYIKSEWKEPLFIKRLFLFRWGKIYYEENSLSSDNDLIQIKDFKVFKVQE